MGKTHVKNIKEGTGGRRHADLTPVKSSGGGGRIG